MNIPVTQKHNFGCGPACVAFVCKKSYDKVVDLLGEEKIVNKGSYCKNLVEVLRQFGFSYEYIYLKPRFRNRIYIDKVIVFIKRSKKYPVGHFFVRYHGTWMDPWINFKNGASVSQSNSGFRSRLPGKPIYALLSISRTKSHSS